MSVDDRMDTIKEHGIREPIYTLHFLLFSSLHTSPSTVSPTYYLIHTYLFPSHSLLPLVPKTFLFFFFLLVISSSIHDLRHSLKKKRVDIEE